MGMLWRPVALFGAIIVSSLLFYVATQYGLLSEGNDVEPNKCTMTYMFPSYFPIPMHNHSRFSKKYGLYYYQDESIHRASPESITSLSGVPLLFIPGNAGSRRQIRSFGTMSGKAHHSSNNQGHRIMSIEELAKEKASLSLNHIDFFSIDLDEELSAFSGHLLSDQTQFVTDCINKILSLYETSISDVSKRPKSVILVGHSMGGVVARAAFTSPTFKTGSVRTILTFNSPHITPPILVHRGVHSFYSRINDFWRLRCAQDDDLKHTVVASVAGGFRDGQVPASLSNLDSIIPCNNHISVVATSIPDVWIPMDHTSCMWCHQLSVVVTSTLARLIDPETRQAIESAQTRMQRIRSSLESNVPAALYLDSPSPRPSPRPLKLDNRASENTNNAKKENNRMEEDQATTKSATSTTSTTSTKATQSTNTASTPTSPSTPSTHTSKTSIDKSHQDQKPNQSQSIVKSSILDLIESTPIETKTTSIKAFGLTKLSNLAVKWDLFEHPSLHQLQLLTTMPLDNLNVLLCGSAGTFNCLDLKHTAAPMPYKMRETSHRLWKTMKAHVLVTDLKDHSASEGYRYLIISSSYNPASTSHNAGFYKGEYGQDIFLVAQLADPVETMTVDGSWVSESSFALDQSLVSRMSLLDASKFIMYHARVIPIQCTSTPLFTPLILEYSPALREERYELESISIRFHDQYLSYNYKKNLSEAIEGSKIRVPLEAQDAIHLFVFSDPVCSYQLILRPDWYATTDSYFRHYGVLILGGLFVMATLSLAFQIRHADMHPSRIVPSMFSVHSRLIVSPWIFALIAVTAVPVVLQHEFVKLGPWLRDHSFATMAHPWPSFHVIIGVYIISICFISVWSLVTNFAFTMIGKVVCSCKQNSTQNSGTDGSNVDNHGVNSQYHHRRAPSLDITLSSWPGAWCCLNPKLAILIFISLATISIFLHSTFTIVIALIMLIWPTNTHSSKFKVGPLHAKPSQDDSLWNIRHGLFVLYSPILIVTVPDLIIWIKNMHFEYRIFDSFEHAAILIALHVLMIKFTAPGVVLQKGASHLHYALIGASLFIGTYALFPVYRNIDVLSFIAALLSFDHILKVVASTEGTKLFSKDH